jgi:hypothetical protein
MTKGLFLTKMIKGHAQTAITLAIFFGIVETKKGFKSTIPAVCF